MKNPLPLVVSPSNHVLRELLSCLRRQAFLDCFLPFVQVKEMRTGAPLIGDQAIGADQIKPLRRRPVCLVYGVVHLFHQYWQGKMQVQAASLGYLFPLLEGLMLPERTPSVTLLSLCHPSVGWASWT